MQHVGRYDIVEEIGRGAMGVVYLGSDGKINRKVALKCLRPELFGGSGEIRKRFQQEILALGRLIHPNIVTIFDAGEDSATGAPYIVMEYVEGPSIGQLLKKGVRLPVEQIIQIGIDMCKGLDFAHSKGVIHRDIKPENILLTAESRLPKISDFGISRLDKGSQTLTDCLMGTPQYMSPEQCKGARLDGRSDLFSVGAFLYELLTHQKAFPGENVAAIMHSVLTKMPAVPSTLFPKIPNALSDLIMKAMEKEPDQRFTSGSEMANALAGLDIGQGLHVKGEPVLPAECQKENPRTVEKPCVPEVLPKPQPRRRFWISIEWGKD